MNKKLIELSEVIVPAVGNTYYHISKGGVYTVDSILPIKLDGLWNLEGAVIYSSTTTGNTFVRLMDDFVRNFAEVEKNEQEIN